MLDSTKIIIPSSVSGSRIQDIAADGFQRFKSIQGPVTRSRVAAQATSNVNRSTVVNISALPQTTSSSHRRHQNPSDANNQTAVVASKQAKSKSKIEKQIEKQIESKSKEQPEAKKCHQLKQHPSNSTLSQSLHHPSALTTSTDDDRVSEESFLENTSCLTVESVDALFERSEVLGEGTYGIVYKAARKDTGEIIALKKLRWESQGEGIPATSVREVTLLRLDGMIN